MTQTIDPNAPAYPYGQVSETTGQPINGFFAPGMTIRATMAMHLMMPITASLINQRVTISYEDAASQCCKLADALIAELNRTTP